jgi:hypothetical protein
MLGTGGRAERANFSLGARGCVPQNIPVDDLSGSNTIKFIHRNIAIELKIIVTIIRGLVRDV